jgi:hypothetical protein
MSRASYMSRFAAVVVPAITPSIRWPAEMIDSPTHIVFLGEAEHLPDLASSLWSQSLRLNLVGDTLNLGVTLLHNAQSQHGQVHADDATSDTLPLALSRSPGPVAAVAVCEQKSDTGWVHDTLLHGETLLVVAAGNLEDVALEFITNRVTRDFLTHAALHEDTETALIFDLDQLLGAIGGV